MWIVFASGAALFAGATAVLAKEGIRTTDSTVATALRTLAVCSFPMGDTLPRRGEMSRLDAAQSLRRRRRSPAAPLKNSRAGSTFFRYAAPWSACRIRCSMET